MILFACDYVLSLFTWAVILPGEQLASHFQMFANLL